MFIYKKESAISDSLCEKFIQEFENSDHKRPGVLFTEGKSTSAGGKKSTDITFDPSFLNNPNWKFLLEPLVDALHVGYDSYHRRFEGGLNSIDNLFISDTFNMQRYLPNEGFFLYHSERGSSDIQFLKRELVWMVYLNDVSNGGETEFYYQRVFERPRKGTLLIWPADWTHLHRGHPSISETKYILTGWFCRDIS